LAAVDRTLISFMACACSLWGSAWQAMSRGGACALWAGAWQTMRHAVHVHCLGGGGQTVHHGIACALWQTTYLKPIGYNLSYLQCRIRHLVPTWQPFVGSSFHLWLIMDVHAHCGRLHNDTNRTQFVLSVIHHCNLHQSPGLRPMPPSYLYISEAARILK
jgi:hypothetical protein